MRFPGKSPKIWAVGTRGKWRETGQQEAYSSKLDNQIGNWLEMSTSFFLWKFLQTHDLGSRSIFGLTPRRAHHKVVDRFRAKRITVSFAQDLGETLDTKIEREQCSQCIQKCTFQSEGSSQVPALFPPSLDQKGKSGRSQKIGCEKPSMSWNFF